MKLGDERAGNLDLEGERAAGFLRDILDAFAQGSPETTHQSVRLELLRSPSIACICSEVAQLRGHRRSQASVQDRRTLSTLCYSKDDIFSKPQNQRNIRTPEHAQKSSVSSDAYS